MQCIFVRICCISVLLLINVHLATDTDAVAIAVVVAVVVVASERRVGVAVDNSNNITDSHHPPIELRSGACVSMCVCVCAPHVNSIPHMLNLRVQNRMPKPERSGRVCRQWVDMVYGHYYLC